VVSKKLELVLRVSDSMLDVQKKTEKNTASEKKASSIHLYSKIFK